MPAIKKTLVVNRNAIFALANGYPNVFTFNTDQELEMIADVGRVRNRRLDCY